MAAVATKSLRAAQSFPTERREWDKLPLSQRSWAAWKRTFTAAHQAAKQEELAAQSAGLPFASGNAAPEMYAADIGNDTTTMTTAPMPPGAILKQVENYMENIAAAATTNHESLAALTKSNAMLVESNKSQQATIKVLWAEIKGLRSRATSGKHRLSVEQERKVICAMKAGWAFGGFCLRHGHGVTRNHTSKSCLSPGEGHVRTATRSSPAGPGAEINKDWDAGL